LVARTTYRFDRDDPFYDATQLEAGAKIIIAAVVLLSR